VDEVLVSYVDSFRQFLERERPHGPLDVQNVFMEAHDPNSPWRLQFATNGGLDNLDPVPGSADALRRLKAAGIRLEVVTSRPPIMRQSTEAMLRRLFPADTFSAHHFVGPGEKGHTCNAIGACALVDDQIQNTIDADACGVISVLFDLFGSYPWSVCSPDELPANVVRLETWAATCEYLLQSLGVPSPSPNYAGTAGTLGLATSGEMMWPGVQVERDRLIPRQRQLATTRVSAGSADLPLHVPQLHRPDYRVSPQRDARRCVQQEYIPRAASWCADTRQELAHENTRMSTNAPPGAGWPYAAHPASPVSSVVAEVHRSQDPRQYQMDQRVQPQQWPMQDTGRLSPSQRPGTPLSSRVSVGQWQQQQQQHQQCTMPMQTIPGPGQYPGQYPGDPRMFGMGYGNPNNYGMSSMHSRDVDDQTACVIA